MVFYPDYRIITTTCLYPVPRREAVSWPELLLIKMECVSKINVSSKFISL